MKSSNITLISTFAAILLASACNDDSASNSTITCGTNEVPSGNACVCDNTNNYYGTPGSCALCTGDHKVVKDNNCVCDTNYEDNSAGGCKQKTTTLTCGEHEIETAGACACDNTNKYYGTAGNCTLCDGTGKIVKDNNCICDDTNFENDGAGGCKQKTTTLTCGEHEIESGGACACDNANKYYGTSGSCELCEGTGKIVKDNACVCDDTAYEDDNAGGCKLKCGEHEVDGGGMCVCDYKNNYYGIAGECSYCSTAVFNNECITEYYNDFSAVGSERVNFGSYKQWPDEGASGYQVETSEPLWWRVLHINKTDRTILLMTEYIIDYQTYDDHEADWKDSQIRNWLNNDFFDTAFTPEEQSIIVESNGDNVSLLGAYSYTIYDRRALPTVYAMKASSSNCSDANNMPTNKLKYDCKTSWGRAGTCYSEWISNCMDGTWFLKGGAGSDPIVNWDNNELISNSSVNSYASGIRPVIWVKY
jgi:hypothetical protein